MYQRAYQIGVVAFWLASVGWLVSAKVWPALRRGNPPDYRQEFAKKTDQPPEPVAWELFWNDRPVGYAVSRAVGTSDNPREIRAVLRLENVKLSEVLRDVFGGFSLLASNLLGGGDFHLRLTLATRLQLNWEGELESFESAVKAEENLDLLFVRGQRTDQDRLQLSVRTLGDSDAATPPLSQDLPLPPETRFADAFSPRSRMAGLRVGQTWTTPVVSPLSPNQAVRLVESKVEKRETVEWHGTKTETFLVTVRQDAGSQSSARGPSGYAWVTDNGLVVRQVVSLGAARLRLERELPEASLGRAEALEESRFEKALRRSWSPGGSSAPK